MKIDEYRRQLITMKIHIDQLECWIRQASDMIYQMEEKLMDDEDAASGIHHFMDCLPRLRERDISSRCSKKHTVAAGLFQSDYQLNKEYNLQETL